MHLYTYAYEHTCAIHTLTHAYKHKQTHTNAHGNACKHLQPPHTPLYPHLTPSTPPRYSLLRGPLEATPRPATPLPDSTDFRLRPPHGTPLRRLKPSNSAFHSMDKSKAMSLVIHCADISHPAKTWEIHHRWTTLLLEEFFLQVYTPSFSTLSPLLPSAHTSCIVQWAEVGVH